MSQGDVELEPEVLQLQGRTREAFRQLVNDRGHEELWQQFRFTFEQRRKLPYLHESGRIPSEPNGLANALAAAFYEFDSPSEEWLVERNKQQGMQTSIDDQFRSDLLDAIKDAVEYDNSPVGFHYFVSALRSRKEQLDAITEDRVREMLEHGLGIYWEQTHARGYSGDPW